MTSGADPTTTTPPAAAETAPVLRRREMLRRGAMLAGGATGAAVVALSPEAAGADDGDNLVLGQANTATLETTLTVGGDAGGATPALGLENADGPSLRMNVLDFTWAGQLGVGEMAGTHLGPIVGVDTAFGLTTTYLVTGEDLKNVATPFASTPIRILNLRSAAGRGNIIRRSSADAVAADGKLRAGQWIDIAIAFTAPDFSLEAVFANLTAVGPVRKGAALLYQPGVRPPLNALQFTQGQTIANAAFVATGEVLQHHAIRLYSSADAWFSVDVSGGLTKGVVQPLAQTQAADTQAAETQRAQAARVHSGRDALIKKVRQAFSRG